MYGCETWVLTKDSQKRVLAFERKCYRKILRIGWTQRIHNEEVYRRVEMKENLMQKIIQRKLGMFGHICRMGDERNIKALVFGMMEGWRGKIKEAGHIESGQMTSKNGAEQTCSS
jgi:hypothetical protein